MAGAENWDLGMPLRTGTFTLRYITKVTGLHLVHLFRRCQVKQIDKASRPCLFICINARMLNMLFLSELKNRKRA